MRKDTVSEQESIAVSSDYMTRYPDLDDPAICDYATYVSETLENLKEYGHQDWLQTAMLRMQKIVG